MKSEKSASGMSSHAGASVLANVGGASSRGATLGGGEDVAPGDSAIPGAGEANRDGAACGAALGNIERTARTNPITPTRRLNRPISQARSRNRRRAPEGASWARSVGPDALRFLRRTIGPTMPRRASWFARATRSARCGQRFSPWRAECSRCVLISISGR